MSRPQGIRCAALLVALLAVGVSTSPLLGNGVCVSDLQAGAVPGGVMLAWTPAAVDHYNIYYGTIAGGPYLKIAADSAPPYLDSLPHVVGTTYYYVIREADAGDSELCQSNEASVVFQIVEAVPALSIWGLTALVLALACLVVLRSRPSATA